MAFTSAELENNRKVMDAFIASPKQLPTGTVVFGGNGSAPGDLRSQNCRILSNPSCKSWLKIKISSDENKQEHGAVAF